MSHSKEMPPVLIELRGPNPPPGREWCATCAVLYLGEVSADPLVQKAAQEQVQKALEEGVEEVTFTMPPSWRRLREAVTTAPSVYFPYPMPVCWLHLHGGIPSGKPDSKVNLIEGKAN